MNGRREQKPTAGDRQSRSLPLPLERTRLLHCQTSSLRQQVRHPTTLVLVVNLVFGGYFSSRWVENIREDKGYTYGPHSLVEHAVAGSALVVAAEVATEVTGPALLETLYELGRLASLPPKEEELEQARQYALGTLQLGMSTQAGLAGLVSTYAGFGLRLDYLRRARRPAGPGQPRGRGGGGRAVPRAVPDRGRRPRRRERRSRSRSRH